MISAVIVNLNEGGKLERCLKSLNNFVDEIIVLDLGSTDETAVICKRYGVKLFKHGFVPFVEEVRNYAIAKATGNWILVLDPDEAIPEGLKKKLSQIIVDDNFAAVNIPRKNIFFGKWIRHTNWWPDRHIRFFKKGKVAWDNKIHSYPVVSGRVLDLNAEEDLALEHFGYGSMSEFMSRQNRYSKIEALNLFSSGTRFSPVLFFWKPVREFLVRYLKHGGFLDGFYGFGLTIFMMIYQLEVMIKLWELEHNK